MDMIEESRIGSPRIRADHCTYTKARYQDGDLVGGWFGVGGIAHGGGVVGMNGWAIVTHLDAVYLGGILGVQGSSDQK